MLMSSALLFCGSPSGSLVKPVKRKRSSSSSGVPRTVSPPPTRYRSASPTSEQQRTEIARYTGFQSFEHFYKPAGESFPNAEAEFGFLTKLTMHSDEQAKKRITPTVEFSNWPDPQKAREMFNTEMSSISAPLIKTHWKDNSNQCERFKATMQPSPYTHEVILPDNQKFLIIARHYDPEDTIVGGGSVIGEPSPPPKKRIKGDNEAG